MNYLNTNKFLSLGVICTLFSFFLLTGCQVEQTEEGELPEVDVAVEEGNMPEYDVDFADVNVSMTEKTVTVPKVIVVTEEVDVQVPVVDVDLPGRENQEMTFTVEVQVEGEGHAVNIEEVYLVDDEFWVVSRLDVNESAQTDAVTRVSDRIVVNAPENLGVRYYIIGEKPAGSMNDQYRFVESRAAIAGELANGQEIYAIHSRS